MLKVINLVRKFHRDTVIIVDDYDYYYIYENDVYVVNYILKLSIKRYRQSVFIKNKISYLNYLITLLKDKHVNYIVIIKRQGYNVDAIEEFKDNNYKAFVTKGKLVYRHKMQVMNIINNLKLNVLDNEEKIKTIKDLIWNYV